MANKFLNAAGLAHLWEKITAAIKTATPNASTTTRGLVKLSDSTSSSSTTTAATSNAVKTAYDKASTKATTAVAGIVRLSASTSSSSNTEAATSSAVKEAYDLADSKTDKAYVDSVIEPVHAFGVTPSSEGLFGQWGAAWGNYGNRYNAPFADHYYIGVDSEAKLHVGTQVNQAKTITWLTIDDYVKEIGSTGIWHYKVWKSGHCEIWGTYNYSGLNAAAHNNNGFYYSDVISIGLPFPIDYIDFCTADGGATDYMCFVRVNGWIKSMVKVWIVGCEPGHTDTSGKIYLYIRGQCSR